MNIERAMEILDPEHRERYDSFEEVEQACAEGIEALREKAERMRREKEPLKIRINTHGGKMPEQHGEWIDLATAEDVVLERLEFKIISLGVSMELPEGYYAQVVPRSSTCKNHGIILANSMGIIEHDYCGDGDVWGFPAVAIRHTEIPAGTRICQFCLVKKHEPVAFEAVESLGNKDRGGWGSTGKM